MAGLLALPTLLVSAACPILSLLDCSPNGRSDGKSMDVHQLARRDLKGSNAKTARNFEFLQRRSRGKETTMYDLWSSPFLLI